MNLTLLELGQTGLASIIETAPLIERLGYRRYWFSQHVGSQFNRNPLLLAPIVAGITERLRVGPAGVLLRYYSPWAVISDALALDEVFPGRIDLGLAAGSAPAEVADALADGRGHHATAAYFNDKFVDACGYVSARATDLAEGGAMLQDLFEVWLLGSGGGRAHLAGEQGSSYCLTLYQDYERIPPPSVLDAYRQSFKPSKISREPVCSIAVQAVCAETQHEAEELAARVHNPWNYPLWRGTPESLRQRFFDLAGEYDVDEIVVADRCLDHESRERSLTLLASAILSAPTKLQCSMEPENDACATRSLEL